MFPSVCLVTTWRFSDAIAELTNWFRKSELELRQNLSELRQNKRICTYGYIDLSSSFKQRKTYINARGGGSENWNLLQIASIVVWKSRIPQELHGDSSYEQKQWAFYCPRISHVQSIYTIVSQHELPLQWSRQEIGLPKPTVNIPFCVSTEVTSGEHWLQAYRKQTGEIQLARDLPGLTSREVGRFSATSTKLV